MSSDSHCAWVDIYDSNEADFLIQDEISIFKTMCNFHYLHSLDKDKYLEAVRYFLRSKILGNYLNIMKKFEETFYDSTNNEHISSSLNQFKYFMNNEKVPRLNYVSKLIVNIISLKLKLSISHYQFTLNFFQVFRKLKMKI
jgi:hypothetical protein